MTQWYFIIDVAKCENCNNCFLACKDEHCGNAWPGYAASQPLHGQRWMNIKRKERGAFPHIDVAYRPQPCMHCDNAPCMVAASNGAVYKRPDGIVIIDPEKAKGQKDLVKSCPYGAISWDDELKRPQKCTFCAHLLDDGWEKPRCAQACPTSALTVLSLENEAMAAMVADQNLQTLSVGTPSTKPRVYYKNLYRFTHWFIAGSLALRKDGIEDCVNGATVKLFRKEALIGETQSDLFGDFKLDRIEPVNASCRIEVHCQGFQMETIEVVAKESLSMGTIWLDANT